MCECTAQGSRASETRDLKGTLAAQRKQQESQVSWDVWESARWLVEESFPGRRNSMCKIRAPRKGNGTRVLGAEEAEGQWEAREDVGQELELGIET